jgi:hypothetical protein
MKNWLIKSPAKAQVIGFGSRRRLSRIRSFARWRCVGYFESSGTRSAEPNMHQLIDEKVSSEGFSAVKVTCADSAIHSLSCSILAVGYYDVGEACRRRLMDYWGVE